MKKYWDDTLKKLIQQYPQAFVSWFLKDASVVKNVPGELENVKLLVDGLVEVTKDGQPMLLHIEFQTSRKPDMAERLLRYNVIARIQRKLPVFSCVIYLLDGGEVPASPLRWSIPGGQEILQFYFKSIELARLTPDELLQMGQPGLLPLLPLTKGGTQRTVIERMFEELGPDQNELALVGFTLASYIFSSSSQIELSWLLERFQNMHDLMRDTPIFQLILKEGKDEGMAEGRTVGRTEGRLVSSRQLLLEFVQKRYPGLLALAQETTARIEQPDELEALALKIVLAQAQSEVEQLLKHHDA